jgi:hypothetical protein
MCLLPEFTCVFLPRIHLCLSPRNSLCLSPRIHCQPRPRERGRELAATYSPAASSDRSAVSDLTARCARPCTSPERREQILRA